MTDRQPPRPTRAASFLGLHHDFHARDSQVAVGARTTPVMVRSIIDAVGPDYIETDAKGHHGFSSYPTNVGNRAPVIVGDPLRTWREVTAAEGVALYVHYSSLLDERAIALEPSWARTKADGQADPRVVSLFSPYVDELMLPQLRELMDTYEIDGVWIDGDCWGHAPDWSPAARDAFRAETGIRDIPKAPGDAHYADFIAFSRETFRRYLRRYVSQLHAWRPGFQVGSSWAFTSFMPEPVSADVDYLSGDSAPVNHSFVRWEARCMALQGLPWDIMTWSFGGRFVLAGKPDVGLKSAIQLKQEAATVLAFGGGYQSVSNQRLDGSINDWHLPLLAEVASFCRDRQALCHNAELVPQVALVHPGAAAYPVEEQLFNSIGRVDPALAILEMLLASQKAVTVTFPHQLMADIDAYEVLVVPDWPEMPEDLVEALLGYAERGGKLLLIGPRNAIRFERWLGVTIGSHVDLDGDLSPIVYLEHEGQLDGHRARACRVDVGSDARSIGRFRLDFDMSSEAAVASTVTRHGAGSIACIYVDLGESYHGASTAITRRFVSSLVDELVPEPMVRVTGTQFADVVVSRKGAATMVHLINTAGRQDDAGVRIFDAIPPVGPIEVAVLADSFTDQARLEPGGGSVESHRAGDRTVFVVPSLDVHAILVLEPRTPA